VTDFRAAADDYLTTRRAMGYKLTYHGFVLREFANHLETAGAEHLTISQALSWACPSTDTTALTAAARLSVIRGFARYMSAFDTATEVPPVGLVREPGHRVVPYIYSERDVAQLLKAAGRLRPEHRADTYQTVIALLAVTGMRVGEAVRLDQDDLDFEQGLLTVRNSKYGKSRQLPLHPTTLAALGAYVVRRDARRPYKRSASLFTSAIGTRLLRDNVSTVFPRLVRECGFRNMGNHRAPRMHDLRHAFAVRTVVSWYREGVDVEQHLPLLSTYLGHISPGTTYWYLSAVPELLELIADRLDATAEAGS